MNIIVADREDLVKSLLKARFAYLKWPSCFASSLDDAVSLLKKNIPDVLVTGIQLEASNGYELIRVIRENNDPKIRILPILILSHMSQPDDISRAKLLGANDYLAKPFDFFVLEKHLIELTNGG